MKAYDRDGGVLRRMDLKNSLYYMKQCTVIWKSWKKHISFIVVLAMTCAERRF